MTTNKNRSRCSYLGAAAFAASLAVSPTASAASDCKRLPYTPDIYDTYFAKKISAKKETTGFETPGLYYWDRMGFHEDEGWARENYGFDDYGSAKMPLGRTLGAFWLMQHSYTPEQKDWNDLSGDIMIRTVYGYTAGGLNELDDLRAGECNGKMLGREQNGALVPDYVILYQYGFQANIASRATTLVHETYHYRRDMDHTCGDGDDYYYNDQKIQQCSGRAGCTWVDNPSPSEPSTYTFGGMWAWSFWKESNVTLSIKDDAHPEKTKEDLTKDLKAMFKNVFRGQMSFICDQTTIPAGIQRSL